MLWSYLSRHSLRASFPIRLATNGACLSPTSVAIHSKLPTSFPRKTLSTFTRLGHRSSYAFNGIRLSYYAGLAGLSIAVSLYQPSATVHCESAPSTEEPAAPPPSRGPAEPAPLPLPLQSSVNLYELGFGTVCGICAGVFVKKGAKALAFTFGGIFVLLQYLGSLSVVRVDWARMSQRFENLFFTKDAQGYARPPTIVSLYTWIVDFLTADFQQRASFVAGFALGLRLG